MNEILTYIGIGFALLLVALIVPGMKYFAQVLLKATLDGLFTLFRQKGTFIVWFIKTLFSDHARVLRHAITPRDKLDPTQKVRRKVEGYED